MVEHAVGGRTTGGLAYEIAGQGDPIVLVHAGIADRRMWDPQWPALASVGRVVRYVAWLNQIYVFVYVFVGILRAQD